MNFMQHEMHLYKEPFDMIKNGSKTIELRLYDKKRKLIHVNDTIVFTSTENPDEKITAKVIALHVFDSFETLYKNLPLLKCGYTPENIANANPSDMESFYTKSQQKKCGVLGIEILVISENL